MSNIHNDMKFGKDIKTIIVVDTSLHSLIFHRQNFSKLKSHKLASEMDLYFVIRYLDIIEYRKMILGKKIQPMFISSFSSSNNGRFIVSQIILSR